MSTLVKRILSSIVFVVLIIGPLFIGARSAYSVYAILGLLTTNELFNLTKKTGTSPNKPLGFLLFIALYLIIYQVGFGHTEIIYYTLLPTAVIGLAVLFSEIFRTKGNPFESISVSLVAPLFTAASFLAIVYFIDYRDDLPQPWMIISVFTLIWVNDSAAYLLGRKIGKRKLFERLSPNKTIEGSLSGLVFSLAAGAGLSFIPGMPSLMIMLAFALVCIVTGSLGDLLESRIKRAAGVKDSGVFLPGHGGFFDRFDAMMLAIPSAILFFEIALPKI